MPHRAGTRASNLCDEFSHSHNPFLKREFRKESAPVQVAIACRHGSLRDDVQDHIRTKAEKLLTYFERVTAISVTVDFGKDRAKNHITVEILVDAEHKHNFVAEDSAPEVAVAFDGALHRMEQQIRKYKEKVQNHRRDMPMSGPLEQETPEPESPPEA
jgi:putative sigma-54 modulation protein